MGRQLSRIMLLDGWRSYMNFGGRRNDGGTQNNRGTQVLDSMIAESILYSSVPSRGPELSFVLRNPFCSLKHHWRTGRPVCWLRFITCKTQVVLFMFYSSMKEWQLAIWNILHTPHRCTWKGMLLQISKQQHLYIKCSVDLIVLCFAWASHCCGCIWWKLDCSYFLMHESADLIYFTLFFSVIEQLEKINEVESKYSQTIFFLYFFFLGVLTFCKKFCRSNSCIMYKSL